MENSDLKERTKLFALRCIKLALVLPKSKLGNHVSGQLIRSSTSVASNYRAAKLAQSKAAFIAKLSIVIEEADVPKLRDWLEVIIDTKLMAEDKVRPFESNNEEGIMNNRSLGNMETVTHKKEDWKQWRIVI